MDNENVGWQNNVFDCQQRQVIGWAVIDIPQEL